MRLEYIFVDTQGVVEYIFIDAQCIISAEYNIEYISVDTVCFYFYWYIVYNW